LVGARPSGLREHPAADRCAIQRIRQDGSEDVSPPAAIACCSSSWSRRAPRVSETLRRRQAGQPPAAIDAAWRAQNRLHRRWAHLDTARAKKRTTVAVAVARELACFVWEIAQQPD
jgi:hypothetical protein